MGGACPKGTGAHPPMGSTTMSRGRSRFSQMRTVLMLPSVLATSIRSVPNEEVRGKGMNSILGPSFTLLPSAPSTEPGLQEMIKKYFATDARQISRELNLEKMMLQVQGPHFEKLYCKAFLLSPRLTWCIENAHFIKTVTEGKPQSIVSFSEMPQNIFEHQLHSSRS